MTHSNSRLAVVRPAFTLSVTLGAHLLTLGACAPGPASAHDDYEGGLPTGAPWADEGTESSGSGSDTGETLRLDLPADEPGDEGSPCEVESYGWEPVYPQLMFVLDHSGSMSNHLSDPLGNPWTRWASLHEVVRLTLERRQSEVEFGLKVFPTPELADSDLCGVESGVEVAPGLMALESIMGAMPDAAGQPQGATPLYAGLSAAGAALEAADSARPRAVLLVADGGISTNCGPFEDADMVSSHVAGLLAEHDVRTYVVAVGPEAALATSLQQVAVAGGTDAVYDSADSLELDMAIGAIVDEVRSCEVQLQAPYPVGSVLRPMVDGTELELGLSCEAGAGFTYDEGFGRLTLCADACAVYFDGAPVEIEDACQPD